MSAGLLASTVTPGITAPLESFTTPAIPLVCAKAVPGTATTTANATPPLRSPSCAYVLLIDAAKPETKRKRERSGDEVARKYAPAIGTSSAAAIYWRLPAQPNPKP